MHSSYSLDHCRRLKLPRVTKLLQKAQEIKQREMMWDLYVSRYQLMTEETFVSFEDFYNPKAKELDNRPVEDILTDVREILDSFRKEGEEEDGII